MEGIAARIAPIFGWTLEKTRDFMNVLNETKTDVTATSFFEDLPRIDESDIPKSLKSIASPSAELISGLKSSTTFVGRTSAQICANSMDF